MGIERNMVKVRCPATTANLGPGFDCVGMAVDIWNELTVTRSDHFEIEIEGEGADSLPKDSTNLVVTGIEAAFKAAGKPVPLLTYKLVNRIPFARGLGSSSAAIVAGLIAGEWKMEDGGWKRGGGEGIAAIGRDFGPGLLVEVEGGSWWNQLRIRDQSCGG